MFINYNPSSGISIRNYRMIGVVCGDIMEFADCVQSEQCACVSLDYVKDEACDSSLWGDKYSHITIDTLESIYNSIEEWEQQQ